MTNIKILIFINRTRIDENINTSEDDSTSFIRDKIVSLKWEVLQSLYRTLVNHTPAFLPRRKCIIFFVVTFLRWSVKETIITSSNSETFPLIFASFFLLLFPLDVPSESIRNVARNITFSLYRINKQRGVSANSSYWFILCSGFFLLGFNERNNEIVSITKRLKLFRTTVLSIRNPFPLRIGGQWLY